MIDIEPYKHLLFFHDGSVSKLLECFNFSKSNCLFVIDNDFRFIGSVTEGDFRRWCIENQRYPDSVLDFTNKSAFYLTDAFGEFDPILIDSPVNYIPVVNSANVLLGFHEINTLRKGRFDRSVQAIAPCRVSLAGGGSDVPDWFLEKPGCVVNLAIAKYARVIVRRRTDKLINITSRNTSEHITLHSSEVSTYRGTKLALVIGVLKRFVMLDGADISITCDFEPGTGLGGSSALVVSLIKAITDLSGYHISLTEIYKAAYEIERTDCGLNGGWQDHIAATFGGLNVTHFNKNGPRVYPQRLEKTIEDFLSSCLFLVRAGGQRSSSDIHHIQKDLLHKKSSIKLMKRLLEVTNTFVEQIGDGDFSHLGTVLDATWEIKQKFGEHIAPTDICKIYSQLKISGASGGRLMGAGKSGYFLTFVNPEKQIQFLSMVEGLGMDIERVQLDLMGCRSFDMRSL